MKKYRKRNNKVFIVSILIIALLFVVSSLVINIKSLTTSYDLDRFYDYEVNASSAVIYATLKDKESFVENYGSREVSLRYGQNILPIQIKTNNSFIKEYSLNIERIDNRSTDARLSNLFISNQEINFDKDKYTYNVSVGADIDSLNVNATLNSDSAKFVDRYGPRVVKIENGLNVIFIKVRSEAGTEKSYKINVFKNSDKTDDITYNDKLESLTLVNEKIDFDPDVFEYDITTTKANIDVYAFASNPSYKIEISGNTTLEEKENTISIKILDDKKVVNEYKIKVNKESKKESLENSTKLQDLNINGLNINFDSNKYTYDVSLDALDKLIVTAYPYLQSSKVSISENQKNNIHQIQILVTNEAGDSKTYTINIKENNWSFIQEIITVMFTFIICIIIIILAKYWELKTSKKKKNSKKKISSSNKNIKKNNSKAKPRKKKRNKVKVPKKKKRKVKNK